MSRLYAGRGVTQGSRSVSCPYKDSYDSSAVTIHNVGASPPLFCTLYLSPSLFRTFSVLVANAEKLLYTMANPAPRGLLNREMYTVVVCTWYALPVAYYFLHVPGIYVWSTLSAEYDMDQPSVVASPAR